MGDSADVWIGALDRFGCGIGRWIARCPQARKVLGSAPHDPEHPAGSPDLLGFALLPRIIGRVDPDNYRLSLDELGWLEIAAISRKYPPYSRI